MQILHQRQIEIVVQRLVIQIMEHNTGERELVIIGINNNGMRLARLLHDALAAVASAPIFLTGVHLNPADPLGSPIYLDLPPHELHGRPLLLVDDVANTGRTLFYACKPLLDILPKKLEIAVMVDRMHKTFPVRVDYVGLELATTLQENIKVDLSEGGYSVELN